MFARNAWTLVARLAAISCVLLGLQVIAGRRGVDDASAGAVPGGSSVFTPISPQRLVDTRIGLGAPMQRLVATTSMDVQVTGHLGIPANATAVVANVTAVDAAGPGYLQVLPTGRAALGSSSTLNVDIAGQTIPNATFAPLGDNGRLTVFAIFTTDVVIDVSGYFTPASSSRAGRLVPLTPNRILDTRVGLGWTPPPPPPPPGPTPPAPTPPAPPGPTPPAPTPPPNPGNTKNCDDFATWREAQDYFEFYFPYYGDVAKLDANHDGIACEDLPGSPVASTKRLDANVPAATVIRLQVAGRGGVPSTGVSAVVMNVTAVEPAGPGFVQVAPTPLTAGASSNLNTAPGRTIANLVVVPLGGSGTVDLYITTPADLVADVVGYFTDGSAANSSAGLFIPVTPNRQLDTREPGHGPPVAAGSVTRVDVNDISSTAIAIAGNATATEAAQLGYLQLAAAPVSPGTSSNVNIAYVGQTIANAVVSPVAAGLVDIYTLNATHELLDVTGWFTSPAPPAPPTSTPPPTTVTQPPPTTAAPSTTTSEPATSTTEATTTTEASTTTTEAEATTSTP